MSLAMKLFGIAMMTLYSQVHVVNKWFLVKALIEQMKIKMALKKANILSHT